MQNILRKLIDKGMDTRVPATGLGVFRILFGLVVLQEIFFLLYFRHLIFDAIPFIDEASAWVSIFLVVWGIATLYLIVGFHTRLVAVANYLFWLLFLVFTPMWEDFDGGFDQFMIGASLLLIFLPVERAFSIDNLRSKLQNSTLTRRYTPRQDASILAYTIPLFVCLGLLYLDSGLHKLSAEFWRNGLGAWLPSTMPYYMSGIDMSWLLNIESFQVGVGYTIMAFQFSFLMLFWFRRFQPILLVLGVMLHVGIIVSLNIYPFGWGMLIHYALLVPVDWWRRIADRLQYKAPVLTVLYDERCPLCLRTVLVVEHFDVIKAIEFKGLQTYAGQYPALANLSEQELLKDLYALDPQGQLYVGLDTYIQILTKMRYLAGIALVIKIPGIYHLARALYRYIADRRERQPCDESCPTSTVQEEPDAAYGLALSRLLGTDRQRRHRLAKFLVVIVFLQLNSTLRYAVVHRLNIDMQATPMRQVVDIASNSLIFFSHTIFGITPHALYMHDHFDGYHQLLSFTYKDTADEERWLPFVNEQGRIVAPNWGRVQSMWANVAVTANIVPWRLEKLTGKVTAFWGTKVGLDLTDTEFTVKMKTVRVPSHWEKDLRDKNLAQPWRDVGKVIWKDKVMRMEINGLPIETR